MASDLPGVGAEDREQPTREQIESRARELGLQPLRWPAQFPFDSTLAMRAATYARQIGRTVPFAQAAFRQAFAGGRSLALQDSVLIAAAACEMHPAAVLRALQMSSVAQELRRTTLWAARSGVREVPAVLVGDAAGDHVGEGSGEQRVFHGERALGEATAFMAARAAAVAGGHT